MKDISNKEYKELYEQKRPKAKLSTNCLKAFCVGGLICMIAQAFNDIYTKVLGIGAVNAASFTSITMIFLGALLTGLGIYDDIGRFAGGGSLVPITGFANSVVSPALEFKKEGLIFGVAAKMFVIAGPVIVYGLSSSMIVGFIYYIVRMILL